MRCTIKAVAVEAAHRHCKRTRSKPDPETVERVLDMVDEDLLFEVIQIKRDIVDQLGNSQAKEIAQMVDEQIIADVAAMGRNTTQ